MIVNFSRRVLTKLLSKKYRDAYVAENVRMGIAYQIRAMREQRNSMSQKALGDLLGKPQSVVSRLEDPGYGKLTLQTLLEVAAAFDVALLVQFVTHGDFLQRMSDVSPLALQTASFSPLEIETKASYREHRFYNLSSQDDARSYPLAGESGEIFIPGASSHSKTIQTGVIGHG